MAKSFRPSEEPHVRTAANKRCREHGGSRILPNMHQMLKYLQNYTKQDLEIPIQKAMCEEWTASKQDKERLEYIMKAIIRYTRGGKRTGAHAERHWQWGTDQYLHWNPTAAPWPEPLVHQRATPLEKQIAQTMQNAKQRMMNNWDKQKQTMEEDMWATQDAIPKYVDGDLEEQPTQEERRSITKNVLALHGLANARQLRNPEKIITTQTRSRSQPEGPTDQWQNKTNWAPGSTWASRTPAQPDQEDPNSASDTP